MAASRVRPFPMFQGRADEALRVHASAFPAARISIIDRRPADEGRRGAAPCSHRPLNTAGRFSTNAFTPSRKSSVLPAASWMRLSRSICSS